MPSRPTRPRLHATDDWHQPYDYADFGATITKFRDLGVEVYLTELDIGLRYDETEEVAGVRVPLPNVDWITFDAEQPPTYYEVVKAAREAGATLLGTWGMTDGTMGTWRQGQRALLLNPDDSRKPAYQSYLQALYDTLP